LIARGSAVEPRAGVGFGRRRSGGRSGAGVPR